MEILIQQQMPSTEKVSRHQAYCQGCGCSFEYEVVDFGGKPLRQHFCNSCEEQMEKDYCTREAEKIRHIRLSAFNEMCPEGMRSLDINLCPSETAIVESILNWHLGPKGLLLHGPTGSGKTRIIWQLVKRLLVEEACSVIALRSSEFARKIESSYATVGGHDTYISSLIAADVVTLDDLGKTRWTERIEADLFDVVDGRTSDNKPIFLTTQYVGETLSKCFIDAETASATIRRLREFCECIEFSRR